MFFRNSRKILLAVGLISIFFPACRFWQKSESNISNSNQAVTSESGENLPFAGKEPENYQAEIVTQIHADGEKIERKTLTVRRGDRRLTIFDWSERSETANLILGQTSFSIFRNGKIYAENKTANLSTGAEDDFLTAIRLNDKTFAEFENLGTENNLTKFRSRGGESDNSEILIYVDESLKMPIRQEFYKIEGERKTLTFSVEIKNFKPSADEKLFELPKDFRQVSTDEFQKIIRREK
jgi:outer membrane lipoprotein-sorting protein